MIFLGNIKVNSLNIKCEAMWQIKSPQKHWKCLISPDVGNMYSGFWNPVFHGMLNTELTYFAWYKSSLIILMHEWKSYIIICIKKKLHYD